MADLWQRVLRAFTLANKEGVSERMWRAYLTFLRSDFASFSVSNVRGMYTSALQRLVVKRKSVPKGIYLVFPSPLSLPSPCPLLPFLIPFLFIYSAGPSYDVSVEYIEQSLLSTLVGWLRLEKQAGYPSFFAPLSYPLLPSLHLSLPSPPPLSPSPSTLVTYDHHKDTLKEPLGCSRRFWSSTCSVPPTSPHSQ